MRDPGHFDRVAELYDAARPSYPNDLVGKVLAFAANGGGPVRRALEFGCGTGQLTKVLTEQGLAVHGLDIGPHLIAIARRKLAHLPDVTFEVADAEGWSGSTGFDLVASGSAFHWLDPPRGFARAADALRRGGTLAIVSNEHPLPLEGFHLRAQSVYRRVLPGASPPASWPSTEERIATVAAGFAIEPRLGPVTVVRHAWTQRYARAAYLRLLRTYSDHGTLPEGQWRALSEGLAAIIDDEYGGTVERPYLTVGWMAHRIA